MNVLFAYFDPTAGSLLLQALVGGFGGIVVVGRYIWTRFIGHESSHVVISTTELNIHQQFRSP